MKILGWGLSLVLLNQSIWAKPSSVEILSPKHERLLCEIANTPETMIQGLMYREHLDKKQGMLFVFPRPSNWNFWMKNTKIKLDIIWLNQDQEVIYMVENALPCHQENCPIYAPNPQVKARYVLEILGGQAQYQKINLGSKLNFQIPISEK
jgi:uncharacterized membrane protein (UPF0127 family)